MFGKELEKESFSFVFIRKDAGDDSVSEIKNFISDKKAFFFSGIDFGKKKNIDRLWNELNGFFTEKPTKEKGKVLEDVFEYIISMANKEKITWVFDNVEELVSYEDFEMVEKFFKALKNTNNTIVFLSQNASFSNKIEESKIIAYMTKSMLNTNTGFYNIKRNIELSAEDKFKYYAVFGDKKSYLSRIDYTKSLNENIVKTFFTTTGVFYSEPNRILKQELRETQVYNLILEAVSKGASTLNGISETLEMSTSVCNKYVTVLLSLGIISKVKPALEGDTRKSKYVLSNSVMNFWYYFVPQNMNDIAMDKGAKAFDMNVNFEMDKYFQIKFPELCREFIGKLKSEGKIKLDIKENGAWWDKKESLDIVAGNGIEAIAADCFWTDSIIGKQELDELEKKSKDIDVIDKFYYLFAKKGFSEELKRIAVERSDIALYSLEDMISSDLKIEKIKKKSFFFSRR